MTYLVTIDGITKRISIDRNGSCLSVGVDEKPVQHIEMTSFGDGELRFVLEDGEQRTVSTAVEGHSVSVVETGVAYFAKVIDERSAGLELGDSEEPGSVVTQMPGAILRVPVNVGDRVQIGDVLVVVEAMKMENEFKATCVGEVAEVCVSVGDIVESDTLLLRVVPEE